jgi:leucyl aminopeptidase
MHVTFAAARPADAAVLALPVEKDGIGRIPAGTLDDATLALARGAAKAGRFDGEAASIAEIFLPGGEHANRLVLVGVGSGREADSERAGGALAARFLTSGVTSIAVDFASLGGQPSSRAVSRFAAAAAQRGWRFDQYRTKLSDKQKPTLEEIVLVSTPNGSEAAWDAQLAVTGGLELTRTLVSEPPNVIYPESFVERCRHLAELGVEITVLNRAAMEKLGMGALLGVAQGSVKEGRILAMRWNGKGAGDIDVAFVGKGVTFDTGGISIKPAAGMEDMKWDMGGAGAVAGAMKALATRKAKANVVGVCGLVENMPDGNAQRPGDVVTSMSGQTIEVINTDAEGRLVLCDAITWTQKTFAPKTIVDLATLTGAMIISLGSEHGGLFANDDGLAEELLAAGRATGDLLWRFPLGDAYNKLIDSPIADMKNVGPRGAGSITAAQFIQRFVEPGVRWAHLDIAGMVWADKPGSTYDKGATGYGVRLLDRFVRDNFEG